MPRPINRGRFTTTPRAADAELWDLVDRAAAGNVAAFAEFFDATWPAVYTYACRRLLGDQETAQEITLDVYVSAWRAIGRVTRIAASPAAWLRTIAQRRIIDHHRAQQRRNENPAGSLFDLAAPRRPNAGPIFAELTVQAVEDYYIDRAEADTVWAYAQRLSPDQHLVLRCRFWFGLSVEDTAAAMHRPTAAVKSLQYRALRTLRGMLTGTELDPRAGEVLVAA